MANGLNKVMLIGNLGADPEARYTPAGKAVTSFRVGVDHYVARQDGSGEKETEWFSVVAWDKLAETCGQFLTKGKKVYVEGRLQTRSWQGQDGQTKYRTEVVATTMLMLDRPQQDQQGYRNDAPAPSGWTEPDEQDSIPF
jgi:single-strand DNA-binding protein